MGLGRRADLRRRVVQGTTLASFACAVRIRFCGRGLLDRHSTLLVLHLGVTLDVRDKDQQTSAVPAPSRGGALPLEPKWLRNPAGTQSD